MGIEESLEALLHAFDLVSEGQTAVEFDWFGYDDHGRLGVFLTAGSLPVPPSVVRSREAFAQLARRVLELPTETQSDFLPNAAQEVEGWPDYGAKGLFVFDRGRRLVDGYICIQAPREARTTGEFSTEMLTSAVHFPGEFSLGCSISVADGRVRAAT